MGSRNCVYTLEEVYVDEWMGFPRAWLLSLHRTNLILTSQRLDCSSTHAQQRNK